MGAPAPALTPRAPLGNPHSSFICKMERADLLHRTNLESINVEPAFRRGKTLYKHYVSFSS